MQKRNIIIRNLLIVSLLILAGCFSIENSCLKTTLDQQVVVSNYGWYLFEFIPLACGNANENASLPWAFFRNDVTMDKIQARFFSYVDKKDGFETIDLSYRVNESVLFEIPGSNIPIPLPYIFTYKEIQLSGVLASKKELVK